VSNIKPNIKARFVGHRTQIFSNKSDAIAIAVTKPAATGGRVSVPVSGPITAATLHNPNNITYLHLLSPIRASHQIRAILRREIRVGLSNKSYRFPADRGDPEI
jgi:hypothetical protein